MKMTYHLKIKGKYMSIFMFRVVLGKRSFAKERGIVTELPEIGYIEQLNDEDYHTKTYIWFYGEW